MGTQCVLCDMNQGVLGGPIMWENQDAYAIRCPRCGNYVFDWLTTLPVIRETYGEQRHILSGVIRTRREAGQTAFVELSEASIGQMINDAPVPQTATDFVDSLLLYLADRLDRPWEPITHDRENDYPLLFMRNPGDMNGFINFARELEYLSVDGIDWRFTVQGWSRVERLKKALPDARQAFVAMWFDESLDEVYDHGFKLGIEDSEYFTAIRADRAHHLGKIDDWIISQIRRSGLLVADFTGNRGGVYYEAGFAQAPGLPVIFSCRKEEMQEVHFDTNHFPHILWESSDELRRKIDDRIRAVILPQASRRAVTGDEIAGGGH